MSNNNNNSNSTGVSFLTLLTILFIGLKLGDVIDWSWWWVLSPTWVPIAIVTFVVIPTLVIISLTNPKK